MLIEINSIRYKTINTNLPKVEGFTYIYALVDPRFNRIIYVGKGTNPYRRMTYHMSTSKSRVALGTSNQKHHYLDAMRVARVKPTVILLEVCNLKYWKEREKHYIASFPNLLNIKEGGEGLTSKDAFTKSVTVYNLDMTYHSEYPSVVEAAKCLGVTSENLSMHLTGKSKRCGKYVVRYTREVVRDHQIKNNSILQVNWLGELVEAFDTTDQASDKLGVSEEKIYACLKGEEVLGMTTFRMARDFFSEE